MKKTCVIGHFGFGQELLNGQTIKTKIISSELEKQLGSDRVIRMDLAGRLKRIPGFLIKIPGILAACDHVIIMPVENGLRFLTPLLGFWNFFFRRKLHYVVIGGWLPEFLKRHGVLAHGLKAFHGIYVETHTMKHALEKQKFGNVIVMPNCKKLRILTEDELIYPDGMTLRLCTFSRVMKEKGIETAVETITQINTELGYTAFSLDIYGQVDSNQTEWFAELKRNFPEFVSYKGCVEADKSVDVLRHYAALLFPTHFYTEGIPGTIVDAYAAGIPVISAEWESYADVVEEGRSGIGYTFDDLEQLKAVLKRVNEVPSILSGMKPFCLRKAAEYRSDKVIRILSNQMLSPTESDRAK